MDAGTERNGMITKRFNLKTGTSGDRLAFAVPGHLGMTVDQVSNAITEYAAFRNYDLSQYTVVSGDQRSADCGSHMFTDGSDEVDNGQSNTEDANDAAALQAAQTAEAQLAIAQ